METQQKIINSNSVFTNSYLDGKALYMYCFNSIPCISFINHINGEKAFEAVKEKYSTMIQSVHSSRYHERKKKRMEFDETVIVLNNQCVLEFNSRYCEILHNYSSNEFVEELIQLLKTFKEKQRRKPLEINLIVKSGSYMELKAMEIKRTKLDLDLYYEDDFKETDEIIRKRLNQKNDKGIVLLHGLPGTGKTTYLRYLIGKINKRVMFLSPNIAGSLVDPEFIDLMVDNPNSVVIIEDAENIIMDRRSNSNSAVSNLLNISDGLLADFLNVQLICTFNNSLTLVDSALMRKGRLIAKYEFGKLSVIKAQRLSNHLRMNNTITKPMTIAEIANPGEKEHYTGRTEIIGFKQQLIEN
ncbi:MAG: AAA family ATPase [Sphingobacteriales bacterium]|nr:AAA family ATPase [Sphingobacteriales bacterium]MBI3717422.1 AAA family ATPase [Sphingobacteriales bacterium]